MGVFPHQGDGVGGCLYTSDKVEPTTNGALLYFSASGRLEEAENFCKELGGKVLEPKHKIGPYGFRSVVIDSEGNRIALHSEK